MRMEEARKKYEDIPIPKELSERVMQEVRDSKEQHRKMMKKNSFVKKGLIAAAAVAVIFTAGVNTSTAFAQGISDIPVIRAVARVLTFRSYEVETEDMKIAVDIPNIEMISDDLKDMEKSVNKEIYELCEKYADEAVERAEAYRQAFLDTGGTMEEWASHNITIKVWYEVKSQTADYLSLAVMGAESWTSAYSETRYYNFDLKEGRQITLEDILGKDYARIADESIRLQMTQREAESGLEYWEEEFEGVDENTKFYVNESGNPVIVFDKYTIAPGAAGQQEFEVGRPQADQESRAGESAIESTVKSAEPDTKKIEFRNDYEDNFAVENEVAAEYGRLVKAAVAEKNVEQLADLTGFPVYVGFPEKGIVVENRDDFTALEAEKLFTDEMVESMAEADETKLNPSMAGFTLYGREGAPGITFGVRDGSLKISGINY